MIRYIKYSYSLLAVAILFSACQKTEYRMGSLSAPTDVVISATPLGIDAGNPNGDGSGDVQIEITGKNVLNYRIDYDASDGLSLENLPSGRTTRKYTNLGLNTYRITVVAYGAGASSTTVTKEVQVQSNFTPDEELVNNVIGTGTKTWRVDKEVSAHFGVGPWSTTSTTPEWYSAPPNDKEGCCACFYTARFVFTRVNPASYTLTVNAPNGAFTKTGALAGGLPGIPASGAEACYDGYTGGTSVFQFIPSGSGIAESTPSTKTAILLGGSNTYIGYGAVQKEYEILNVTETTMDLRVRGTETGNAWYLKLIAI